MAHRLSVSRPDVPFSPTDASAPPRYRLPPSVRRARLRRGLLPARVGERADQLLRRPAASGWPPWAGGPTAPRPGRRPGSAGPPHSRPSPRATRSIAPGAQPRFRTRSAVLSAAPGSTKNSIRRSGVQVTGPSVTFIRSIRASARQPADSGTSSASKVRPVGSRIEALGRFDHSRARRDGAARRLRRPVGTGRVRPGCRRSRDGRRSSAPAVHRLQPGAGEHVPVPLLRVPHRAVQQLIAPLPGNLAVNLPGNLAGELPGELSGARGSAGLFGSDGLFHATHNCRYHHGLRGARRRGRGASILHTGRMDACAGARGKGWSGKGVATLGGPTTYGQPRREPGRVS